MMHSYPWGHIICDDFYESGLFESMKNEIVKYFVDLEVRPKRMVYRTRDNGFESQFPQTSSCLSSVDYSKYLAEFPIKRSYNSVDMFSEISFISDGFEYPLHCENEEKVLSFVTYVAPAKGRGTRIYDTDKTFVKEVEWKPNRMLVFAGLTGTTWHNYVVDPRMPRITINTFIVRK